MCRSKGKRPLRLVSHNKDGAMVRQIATDTLLERLFNHCTMYITIKDVKTKSVLYETTPKSAGDADFSALSRLLS